jgi:hypothetical protein
VSSRKNIRQKNLTNLTISLKKSLSNNAHGFFSSFVDGYPCFSTGFHDARVPQEEVWRKAAENLPLRVSPHPLYPHQDNGQFAFLWVFLFGWLVGSLFNNHNDKY